MSRARDEEDDSSPTVAQVRRLAAADHGLAVVATSRADGSAQCSVVNAGVMVHPVTTRPVVAFVARGGTVKLRNLRARPHATVVFRAGWQWVAVEGWVTLAGPDDVTEEIPLPTIPQLLRDVFLAAGGQHDNWAEYDRVMAEDRRTAVFVELDKVYPTT